MNIPIGPGDPGNLPPPPDLPVFADTLQVRLQIAAPGEPMQPDISKLPGGDLQIRVPNPNNLPVQLSVTLNTSMQRTG